MADFRCFESFGAKLCDENQNSKSPNKKTINQLFSTCYLWKQVSRAIRSSLQYQHIHPRRGYKSHNIRKPTQRINREDKDLNGRWGFVRRSRQSREKKKNVL